MTLADQSDDISNVSPTSGTVRLLAANWLERGNIFGDDSRLQLRLLAPTAMAVASCVDGAAADLGLDAGRLRRLDLTGPALGWQRLAALIEAWQLADGGVPFRRAPAARYGRDGVVVLVCSGSQQIVARAAARAVLAAAAARAGLMLSPLPDPAMAIAAARLRGLSYSGRALALEALRRRLPLRPDGSGVVSAGDGVAARSFRDALLEFTSPIAVRVAADKLATKRRLYAAGLPTPPATEVGDATMAVAAAASLRGKVVLKPRFGSTGTGVRFASAAEPAAVSTAFAASRAHGAAILIEPWIAGADFRLLVAGGRMLAAVERRPPVIVGDGSATVAALIDRLNVGRGAPHTAQLVTVAVDDDVLSTLAVQGFDLTSRLPRGRRVSLRLAANLSTGADARDCTDEVHPTVAAAAVAAAAAVGLDVAGVDVIATDLCRPLAASGGTIIEVNSSPGLRAHRQPSAGRSRHVAAAIVDLLFPLPTSGRVPVWLIVDHPLAPTTFAAASTLGRPGTAAATSRRTVYAHGSDGTTGDRHPAHILAARTTGAAVIGLSAHELLTRGIGTSRLDGAIILAAGFRAAAVAAGEPVAEVVAVVRRALGPGGRLVVDAALRGPGSPVVGDGIWIDNAIDHGRPAALAALFAGRSDR